MCHNSSCGPSGRKKGSVYAPPIASLDEPGGVYTPESADANGNAGLHGLILNISETAWVTRLERAADELLRIGGTVFSLAIVGLGVETLLWARYAAYDKNFGAPYKAIPVIPFLPQIPWLAYAFGAILAACGVALLSRRTVRTAAMVVGSLMFLGAVLLDAPKYFANLDNMSVRTELFEPVALATLAWLLPGRDATPPFLERASRYLLALSYVVFGVDHFLALAPIGTLIPNWIPWHVFWIAFFGAGFIAAGVGIALNVLLRYAAAGIGLMYAIWVFTLHIPRVFGLYGGAGPKNPDEWSSLLIAIALWGGSWALARANQEAPAQP